MQFSIALPIFRQAEYLPTALESIRVQARDVQLAVMDATPDDSVQRVLDGYRDLLQYHRQGPDAGQSSAIQEGWDNTNGEVVAWLCADDYYFPDTLAAVRKVFMKRPGVDVVYGDSVFVNAAGHFVGYFPGTACDVSSIVDGNCISQPSCFVRRSAMEAVGRLNPALQYTMDWDLWTRLYRSGAHFHFLKKPLSVVRMHEDTKTASRSWRRFYEIGRHLWLNTSPAAAGRSLMRHFFYDLSTLRVSGPERLLLAARAFYHQQRPRTIDDRGIGSRSQYGLSSDGNAVVDQAEVFLPWYQHEPPAEVRIRCDLETAPEVHLNDHLLEVRHGVRFSYGIPATELPSRVVGLRLRSTTGRTWHLHAVEIR